MSIIGLDGRPIAETVGTRSNAGKVTQAIAGAVITSEIELAVAKWNEGAIGVDMADKKNAPVFEVKFDKFSYSEKAAEKSGYYGYALLKIVLYHKGKPVDIYTKAVSCKTLRDLDNVNGYYPNIAIDCLGFLIASGLMYNLAMQDLNMQQNGTKTEESIQPPADKQSKPGTGSKRKSGK